MGSHAEPARVSVRRPEAAADPGRWSHPARSGSRASGKQEPGRRAAQRAGPAPAGLARGQWTRSPCLRICGRPRPGRPAVGTDGRGRILAPSFCATGTHLRPVRWSGRPDGSAHRSTAAGRRDRVRAAGAAADGGGRIRRSSRRAHDVGHTTHDRPGSRAGGAYHRDCRDGRRGQDRVAVHWAHRVAQRFPDGQLYVDLRGFGPTRASMDPTEAIGVFSTRSACRRADSGQPARAGRAVPQPAVRQTGARRAGQRVRRRPGPPAVARRSRVRGGRDQPRPDDRAGRDRRCRPVAPGPVAGRGCAAMLARRIGTPGGRGARRGGELIARCARLPLALAVVGARAVTRPGTTLASLAARLRETPRPWMP